MSLFDCGACLRSRSSSSRAVSASVLACIFASYAVPRRLMVLSLQPRWASRLVWELNSVSFVDCFSVQAHDQASPHTAGKGVMKGVPRANPVLALAVKNSASLSESESETSTARSLPLTLIVDGSPSGDEHQKLNV